MKDVMKEFVIVRTHGTGSIVFSRTDPAVGFQKAGCLDPPLSRLAAADVCIGLPGQVPGVFAAGGAGHCECVRGAVIDSRKSTAR